MKKIITICYLLVCVLGSTYSQKGWKWDTTIYYDENMKIKIGAKLELSPDVSGEVTVPDYKKIKGKELPEGDVNLGELRKYLTTEVKRQSFVENSKMQTPSVSVSMQLQDSWRTMKLR